jgi:hypothetical protein
MALFGAAAPFFEVVLLRRNLLSQHRFLHVAAVHHIFR